MKLSGCLERLAGAIRSLISTRAEVAPVRRERSQLVLLERDDRIGEGGAAASRAETRSVGASEGLLGRVVNALGEPIDGMGPVGDLTPVPLRRPRRTARRLAMRIPLGITGAPGVFRGAAAVLRVGWPDAGPRLGRIARGWKKPIVVLLAGGSVFEHAIFSADLGESFYRSVVISEPRELCPFAALKAYRVGAALASYFASLAGDALFLVGWRLRGRPTVSEAGVSHDVTSIWTIEGPTTGFDLEIGAAAVEGRAA